MKREDIMTTYKNLQTMNRSWDMVTNANKVSVNPNVVEYAEKFGKKEAYLYNNRLLAYYINPSELRKAEYNANRDYIKIL